LACAPLAKNAAKLIACWAHSKTPSFFTIVRRRKTHRLCAPYKGAAAVRPCVFGRFRGNFPTQQTCSSTRPSGAPHRGLRTRASINPTSTGRKRMVRNNGLLQSQTKRAGGFGRTLQPSLHSNRGS
jgi:hypothetical protein